MPKFYSPTGNPEMWAEKPIGYYTEEEWHKDHPMTVFEPDDEFYFGTLRSIRDMKLSETDYLFTDYPITEECRLAVSAYRKALRDLPAQEGAPWDGGGEKTPWPAMPEIVVSGSDPVAAEVHEVQKEDSSLQKGSSAEAAAD